MLNAILMSGTFFLLVCRVLWLLASKFKPFCPHFKNFCNKIYVPGKPFQLSLMFLGKVRTLH